LSVTCESCLGLIPSTTEVLGLKLADAVRSSCAVISWVLFVVSWLLSGGVGVCVCAVVVLHFQKLVHVSTWSLSSEDGWRVPYVAVLWCCSGF
jgi:hypothetical protein